jgi:hypothetical protein
MLLYPMEVRLDSDELPRTFAAILYLVLHCEKLEYQKSQIINEWDIVQPK